MYRHIHTYVCVYTICVSAKRNPNKIFRDFFFLSVPLILWTSAKSCGVKLCNFSRGARLISTDFPFPAIIIIIIIIVARSFFRGKKESRAKKKGAPKGYGSGRRWTNRVPFVIFFPSRPHKLDNNIPEEQRWEMTVIFRDDAGGSVSRARMAPFGGDDACDDCLVGDKRKRNGFYRMSRVC